jgi:hypothetical protein
MTTELRNRDEATLQTTNATPTTILTYPMPDATIAYLDVSLVARRPSNGDSAAFQIRKGAFKRHGGAATAAVGAGTTTDIEADAGASTWAVNIFQSGNNVVVQVQGQANATIEWLAWVEVVLYTP